MAAPVLAFFNVKGGVGSTFLIYHLAWMLSGIGERVLACDLDPQATLTATFLNEGLLESLWEDSAKDRTIYQCVQPLTAAEDVREPQVHRVSESLGLIPGDLALSGFEERLSSEWPNALGESDLYRPFRILTAFRQIVQSGAAAMDATIVLVDVGPNLGALNRSALIATDRVIVPLGTDLFSLRSLRNLGPALARWAAEWSRRRNNWQPPGFSLPDGAMTPTGYIVQQHGVRRGRPGLADDEWVNRMPEAYRRHVLNSECGPVPARPVDDEHCLATVPRYVSLVSMAQEARKPIFHLTVADGALGSHAAAASCAYRDFRTLADSIREKIGLSP